MSEPLVIVGNGMAAARLVEELDRSARGRYAVAVIGDEPRLAYNRVLLSSVLAGETGSHEIELKPPRQQSGLLRFARNDRRGGTVASHPRSSWPGQAWS